MPETHILHRQTETGQFKSFAPRLAVVQSSGLQSRWHGFVVEHHRLLPDETPELWIAKQIVTLNVGPPIQVEWHERGQYMGRRMVPGDISLTPAHSRERIRWRDNCAEFLVCELDREFLERADEAAGKRNSLEIRPARGIQDARIAPILLALQADMQAGYSSGRLYGETLAAALAVHLTQTYAASRAAANSSAPLARRELRCAFDYIHDHLETDFSLHDLAREVGLSPSHFARMFRQATGQPPHRYVIHARIEQAQTLLRRDDATVSAVAARLGFYDESHFIRHFKRITGMSPHAWRKQE